MKVVLSTLLVLTVGFGSLMLVQAKPVVPVEDDKHEHHSDHGEQAHDDHGHGEHSHDDHHAETRRVPQSFTEYKAIARPELETMGRDDGREKRGVLINNEHLTAALNQLAKEGWRLVEIEQRHTKPITGPKGTTYSNPATYIFQRVVRERPESE